MSETYRRVGDSIVRLKDDKVMAAIKDGKVCPSAPAYFKKEILAELNTLLSKSETKVEPSDWAKELNESVESEKNETPVIPVSRPHVDSLARELEKVFNGPKPVHRDIFVTLADFVRSRYGEKIEEDAPIDFSKAPKCDPSLGDLTPEFMVWFRANHPDEAIKRYGK
jgi:hypothetical protein